MFLHFCMLYPTKQQLFAKRRWRVIVLYVPALLLLVMAAIVFLPLAGFVVIAKMLTAFGFTVGRISDSFGILFYDLSFLHFLIGIVAGSLLLVRTYVTSKNALVRQQMKWVVWGTVFAVTPFTLLYGIGHLFDAATDRWLRSTRRP